MWWFAATDGRFLRVPEARAIVLQGIAFDGLSDDQQVWALHFAWRHEDISVESLASLHAEQVSPHPPTLFESPLHLENQTERSLRFVKCLRWVVIKPR